jgi:flagellar basal-body rod protein FlgF
MDALTSAAAGGLRARMEALELLANNLANASTNGYKSDRESYGIYLAPEAEAGSFASTMPVMEREWTDFSQGSLRATGNPLDFAIDGQGFFAIDGPSGVLYTRNGAFQVTPAGQLATAEGYVVRGSGGKPIMLDPAQPVDVLPDGTVRQGGQTAGRMEIVEFPSTTALSKRQGTYFRASGAAPSPSQATVGQGKLEGSNVPGPESAVRLIGVMRQFEMLQKAISLGGEMNRRALEEVARVGS